MPRRAAADLNVVPMPGGGRPPPPADLDAIEGHIWRSVVDSSPAFAIDPAAQLILRRICAQAALCEQREARLRQLRAGRSDTDEELLALATAHGIGAKTLTILLTSLRATPRSKTRLRDTASKTPRVPADRPWNDGLSSA